MTPSVLSVPALKAVNWSEPIINFPFKILDSPGILKRAFLISSFLSLYSSSTAAKAIKQETIWPSKFSVTFKIPFPIFKTAFLMPEFLKLEGPDLAIFKILPSRSAKAVIVLVPPPSIPIT